MADGSVAVPYCWDRCFVSDRTGAGPAEEGVCCWLTRLKRHDWGTSDGLQARSVRPFIVPQWPEQNTCFVRWFGGMVAVSAAQIGGRRNQ